MKKTLLAFFYIGICVIANAQQFTLLKDINPGTASSNVCYLTNVNNTLFFAANNGINGMELWKSNGTESSTVLVKDINEGSASSSLGYLTQVNNLLFFVANSGSTGTELWKSDGTPDGTVMVKNIRPGSLGSNPSSLVNVNGTLYFAADDGVNGVELWKSDGTLDGTIMVIDINPYSGCSYPQAMANINGILYFAADNGEKGMELWKSDGTAAGTVLVKDVWTGTGSSYPFELVNVNGTLFFSANNGTKGTELWKSDGTTAGTVLVKDIRTGTGESYPFGLKNVNGILFFSADDGFKGTELWKTDGTTTGTVLVKDIWAGTGDGAVGNFSKAMNKLIFTGNDGVNGYKAWESDGTESGTTIVTGVGDPGNGDLQELVETDNNIYAGIRKTDIGRELWSISYTSVLPLNLLEFNGRLEGEDALLNWKTENERNTKEFVVERSVDGDNFSSVAIIESFNSPGVHQYTYIDNKVAGLESEVIYYRLKQIDANSQFIYSKIVSLSLAGKTGVKLYPNPAISEIKLIVDGLRKEKLDCQVFDNAGRLVIMNTKQLISGTNSLSFDINKLSAGVYYIKLSSNSINKRVQFIKR